MARECVRDGEKVRGKREGKLTSADIKIVHRCVWRCRRPVTREERKAGRYEGRKEDDNGRKLIKFGRT
jgi:hypothetical protein